MHIDIKYFSKKVVASAILGAAFVVGSVAYAAATIPAACATPGTCTDITSTFQAVASKTTMKFFGSNNTNFVALQAPAGQAADVTLTLPSDVGAAGEVLSTDGAGVLSWVASAVGSFAGLSDTDFTGLAVGAINYFDGTNWVDLPKGTAGQSLAMNAGATAPEWISNPLSADRFLGMIAFMMPHAGSNIHEINGQTVTDAKLATYITANPITGFSVVGNDVTLPDWRGRYLGANGAKGIGSTSGQLIASTNKRHRHGIATQHNEASSGDLTPGGGGSSGTYYTGYEGSTYARPETTGMPMVIIGGSN